MLCSFGFTIASDWRCCSDNYSHVHIKGDSKIRFYGGSVKSIKTSACYLEWNIRLEPVIEMVHTAVVYRVTYMDNPDDNLYRLPWDRLPVGFCYWEHKDGPAREHVNEDHSELIAAIMMLPLPIARAVLKQMPLLTLDSWRAEFRARWPMGQTLARALAGEI